MAGGDASADNGVIVLFVYGTLMRGERHHGFLRGARFLGAARTAPGFRLLDLGGYPGLVRGEVVVEGELYLVEDDETVRYLDALEEHPDYYRRQRIALEDGRSAVAYVLVEPSSAPAIPGGSWRERRSR